MTLAEPSPMAQSARKAVRDTVLALMGITRTTQTALAVVMGMDQGGLSKRLKAGGPPFTEDHLARAAEFFGVEVPDLYDTAAAVSKIRSRCSGLMPLPAIVGQQELALGIDTPELVAV